MTKILTIIILTLCAFTTPVKAQNNDLSEEQITYVFLKGVEAYNQKQVEKTVKIFVSLLQQKPNHAPSNYYLAKVLNEQEMYKDALKFAERAAENEPENYDMQWLKAGLELENDDMQSAAETMAKLRELKPQNIRHYIVEMAMLNELQNFERLLEIANITEQKFGPNEETVNHKFRALHHLDSLPVAIKYMEKMVAKFPENIEFTGKLALGYAFEGEEEKARKLFAKMVRENPKSREAQLRALDFYQLSNQNKEAIEIIEMMIKNPNFSAEEKIETFEENFFNAEYYIKHAEKINEIMNELMMIHGDTRDAKMLQIRYLYYTNKVEETLEKLDQINEEYPDYIGGYYTKLRVLQLENMKPEMIEYARVYDKQFNSTDSKLQVIIALNNNKRYKEAIQETDKLLKRKLSDTVKTEIIAFKGDLLYQDEQYKKAYKTYEKALKINPQYATALNNYAYFITLDPKHTPKMLEKALEMATKACEINPDSPTFLDTKAAVLMKLGKLSDAQLIMSHALKISKNPHPDLIIRYADILFELGDKKVAKKYWNQALEAGADKNKIEERLQKLQ